MTTQVDIVNQMILYAALRRRSKKDVNSSMSLKHLAPITSLDYANLHAQSPSAETFLSCERR